ncbi:MAG TPA: class I SAM-dependent methyltransferase [Gammaproteobacteria bacterium]|nr:class I SAM-dependent methyltransferase [Gammaproteobacteria bacterium]
MQLNRQPINRTCPEPEIFEALLSLDNQHILELGCGDATLTRLIAGTGSGRQVTAAEVDTIAHKKNLKAADLPNVTFLLAGSEDVPLENESVDTAFMFKSLHHVPVERMDDALQEIHRVLKPGGLAYISEPIFDGEFNEILRLFHNEEGVRQAAFDALTKAVATGLFVLEDEIFFNTPVVFESFDQYVARVIGATHTDHRLSDELMSEVEQQFNLAFAGNNGKFHVPIRVDLLRKQGS